MQKKPNGKFLSGHPFFVNEHGRREDEDGFVTSMDTSKKPWLPWPSCVAIKIDSETVMVRDTKDSSKTTLSFRHDEWDAFIAGVRNGEFDLPAK